MIGQKSQTSKKTYFAHLEVQHIQKYFPATKFDRIDSYNISSSWVCDKMLIHNPHLRTSAADLLPLTQLDAVKPIAEIDAE